MSWTEYDARTDWNEYSGAVAKFKRLEVRGTAYSDWLARQLIEASKWFEFTPLPDGWYEFKVKNEPGLPDTDGRGGLDWEDCGREL